MNLQTFHEKLAPIQNKLYRFSLRIVGNIHDAEDIVQEVMIRVWNKRDEWPTWGNFEAMCMTITKHLSIDRTRGKTRRMVEFPEGFDLESDNRNPEELAITRDSMDQIKGIMTDLPEKQKMVIQLRDIEGLSYKEIAEILEIPLNQVKINLHRARLFMKEHLLSSKTYG